MRERLGPGGSPWLADLAWPGAGQRASDGAVLAVPLGSTEQHGPHLPVSTDTDIAVALCERLAAALLDELVATLIREVAAWRPEPRP